MYPEIHFQLHRDAEKRREVQRKHQLPPAGKPPPKWERRHRGRR